MSAYGYVKTNVGIFKLENPGEYAELLGNYQDFKTSWEILRLIRFMGILKIEYFLEYIRIRNCPNEGLYICSAFEILRCSFLG